LIREGNSATQCWCYGVLRRAGNVEGNAGHVRTKQDRTVEGRKGKIDIGNVEILICFCGQNTC
jgi:hypothetical protein